MQPISIHKFFILIRITLSFTVTFSAFAAYIICGGTINPICISAMAAIFLFSAGTSIINQVQEKKVDALMDRTKNRPIPSGNIKPSTALLISIIFITSGIILFVRENQWIPLYLGIANIIFYNGIYTTLKMRTTLALIPGAVTGSVPVLMGWSAAGGDILSTGALSLGLFMFCWQIPHFWLLMLDRDQEYKTAGIPAMTDHFTLNQVKRMILVWLSAASFSSLMMVAKELSHHFILGGMILFLNTILLLVMIRKLFFSNSDSFRMMFHLVNTFLFIVLVLLIAERFLLHA